MMTRDDIIEEIINLSGKTDPVTQKRLIDLKRSYEKGNISLNEMYKIFSKIRKEILEKDKLYEIEKDRIFKHMLEEEIEKNDSKIFVLQQNLNDLDKTVRRLTDRPQFFEKKAEEKLSNINEKFEELLQLKRGTFNITEKLEDVKKLTKKLEQLEQDAQSIINGTSSVQIGKQYLEAKNAYGWHYYPFNWFKIKGFWKIPAFPVLGLSYVVRNILQKDLILYFLFLSNLGGLIYFYFTHVNVEKFEIKNTILTIPFIWAAWFFQRKINTREKLYEVYNHKQKVMETYIAFKNGSYTLNAEDEMEKVVLFAIKKDPSDCIGKDNTTLVESILDKIRGLFISRKIEKFIDQDGDIN